jgi:CubicO group peptidase (beta-lactamase class C family)
MYLVAGEIVAKVSGLSWDEFVTTRILRPLGMQKATTTVREFTANTNLAMPHNEVGTENVQIDYVNWDNIGPAGSINASVKELTQWIKLQLNRGKMGETVFWSEARAYEMWENENPRPVSNWQRKNQPSRHFSGYGLGWELMEYGGEKIVSHGGGYDGMISKTVLIPGKNIGFVILTNNINSLPSSLTLEILDAYLGVSPKQDWMALFLGFKNEKEEAPEAPVANTKPSLPLTGYAGIYSSELYGDVTVEVDASGAMVIDFKPTALFKGTLSHYHYDTFEMAWSTQMMLPKGKVTFLLDADGRVSEMKVDVPNPDFDFGELKLLKVK